MKIKVCENNGDRNSLIENNMKLVYKVISDLKKKINFENFENDAIQEGFLALIKCADNYDANKGIFSSFAYISIRNKILNFFSKEKNYKRFIDITDPSKIDSIKTPKKSNQI